MFKILCFTALFFSPFAAWARGFSYLGFVISPEKLILIMGVVLGAFFALLYGLAVDRGEFSPERITARVFVAAFVAVSLSGLVLVF